MATKTSGLDRPQVLAQVVREHWVPFLIEGIVLIMLGVLGILMPIIASIAVLTSIGRHQPAVWWCLNDGDGRARAQQC